MSGTLELLPCPFCGASGDELMMFCDPDEGRDNSGPSRRIQCAVCHVEAPFYASEAEAIAAWNRRAATSPAGDRPLTPCHSEGGCIRAYEDDTCGEQGQCSIVLALEAQALRHQSTGVTEITDEMVEKAAAILPRVWPGGFEDQDHVPLVAFRPNDRARQVARDLLRAVLSAGGRT